MKKDLKKIRIQYPDGHVDCDNVVVETYRRARIYRHREKCQLSHNASSSQTLYSYPKRAEGNHKGSSQ